MLKLRFAIPVAVLLAVGTAGAQQPPSSDTDACAKHCQEMKASHQKAMEARQAAWKEIEARLEIARNARGDAKVAALQAAVENLVAYEASAPKGMADGCSMGGSMAAHAHANGHGMACCTGSGSATAAHDCPMMKGSAGSPETAKPAN